MGQKSTLDHKNEEKYNQKIFCGGISKQEKKLFRLRTNFLKKDARARPFGGRDHFPCASAGLGLKKRLRGFLGCQNGSKSDFGP